MVKNIDGYQPKVGDIITSGDLSVVIDIIDDKQVFYRSMIVGEVFAALRMDISAFVNAVKIEGAVIERV